MVRELFAKMAFKKKFWLTKNLSKKKIKHKNFLNFQIMFIHLIKIGRVFSRISFKFRIKKFLSVILGLETIRGGIRKTSYPQESN